MTLLLAQYVVSLGVGAGLWAAACALFFTLTWARSHMDRALRRGNPRLASRATVLLLVLHMLTCGVLLAGFWASYTLSSALFFLMLSCLVGAGMSVGCMLRTELGLVFVYPAVARIVGQRREQRLFRLRSGLTPLRESGKGGRWRAALTGAAASLVTVHLVALAVVVSASTDVREEALDFEQRAGSALSRGDGPTFLPALSVPLVTSGVTGLAFVAIGLLMARQSAAFARRTRAWAVSAGARCAMRWRLRLYGCLVAVHIVAALFQATSPGISPLWVLSTAVLACMVHHMLVISPLWLVVRRNHERLAPVGMTPGFAGYPPAPTPAHPRAGAAVFSGALDVLLSLTALVLVDTEFMRHYAANMAFESGQRSAIWDIRYSNPFGRFVYTRITAPKVSDKQAVWNAALGIPTHLTTKTDEYCRSMMQFSPKAESGLVVLDTVRSDRFRSLIKAQRDLGYSIEHFRQIQE
jgi:uncharacterized membrane protein YhdT